MNNGIKPTRLWHLIGKKHFRSIIKDRETACPPHIQRDKKDQLQLVGLLWSSAVALAYTYGKYEKKKHNVVRPDGTCGPEKDEDKCKPPQAPCMAKKKPEYKPCK